MNSKFIPLIGLLLVVIAAGLLYQNQNTARMEASALSPEAQFRQGEMHEQGWGRPKNTDETIRWYTLAADSGHAEAQFRLGNLYYEGTRVQQDFNQAMEWYLEAANNGHIDAEYQVARMYQLGEGVPVDRVEAEKWLSMAKQQASNQESPASG